MLLFLECAMYHVSNLRTARHGGEVNLRPSGAVEKLQNTRTGRTSVIGLGRGGYPRVVCDLCLIYRMKTWNHPDPGHFRWNCTRLVRGQYQHRYQERRHSTSSSSSNFARRMRPESTVRQTLPCSTKSPSLSSPFQLAYFFSLQFAGNS